MRLQTCHLNQKNQGTDLKRRLEHKGARYKNFLHISLMINLMHIREEWKKLHVAKLKFLLKKTKLTRDQAKSKLESNV